MAKMTKEVTDLLNDPKASKVLATCDSDGNLNVVPKGSLVAVDEETIAFADIFGGKPTRTSMLPVGQQWQSLRRIYRLSAIRSRESPGVFRPRGRCMKTSLHR